MTFGAEPGGDDHARAVFRAYLEAGGNLLDTAVNYAGGRSEDLLGRLVAETGERESLVLSTKYTFPHAGHPNAVGNGRTNALASLDTSLRRLRTDYVDLYWLHLWDTATPAETVMATFDALVRSGRVRAVGLSNTPAWYAAECVLVAQRYGWEPPCALQLPYSLTRRQIEREHVGVAQRFGLSIVPWSPLDGGFLSGKYAGPGQRGTVGGDGRLATAAYQAGPAAMMQPDPAAWAVLDVLRQIAAEAGATPAAVALRWLLDRPTVTSVLLGARTPAQLATNLAARDTELTAEQVTRLEEAGRPAPQLPYTMFDAAVLPAARALVRR
jgi:aryl-alcohol dehydrogenase-like predicted oxidoreductase